MPRPVCFFLIDGLRPDALDQCRVPTLRRLEAEGAGTRRARTVFPPVTLPAIVSIFHSVPPQTHGTLDNTFHPAGIVVPGLFDLYRQAGRRTASFINWDPLRDLSRPGAVEILVCLNTAGRHDVPIGTSDRRLTDLALQLATPNLPDFTFLYLGCLDEVGHRYGWMSKPYLQALEIADECIGRVLENLPSDALVVVGSDHGGHGTNHGEDIPEDMTVPLILHGSGVPSDLLEGPVTTLDIAPTIAAWAGLALPKGWMGSNLGAALSAPSTATS